MFNVIRRYIIFLIYLGFLVIEWLLYSNHMQYIPETVFVSTKNSLLPRQSPLLAKHHLINSKSESLFNLIDFIASGQTTIMVEKSKKTINNEQPKPTNSNELHVLIENYSKDKQLKGEANFKRILFWNKFKREKNYGVGLGRDSLRKWGCPVWQCETSDNRTNVQDFDAIVFHLRTWNKKDIPKLRSPHQRYVFFSVESAAWRAYSVAPMANFFNWTMTYRWDSDIVYPYGYIKPTGNAPFHPSESQMKYFLSFPKNKVNYARGKTKMATWFVSNCKTVHSNRNKLIELLQKYNIQVDVYGKCGNMTCPKKQDKSFESSDECREMAAKKYKFYFALENSLCRHYVTEKFFENIRRPILPVVFGLHDDHEKLAPLHSFINAAKFKNMKALADHLILLDKNDKLYNEYFWWKPHFQVRDSQRDKNQAMCHLCARLHDKTRPVKIYSNLTNWWETKSTCFYSPIIA